MIICLHRNCFPRIQLTVSKELFYTILFTCSLRLLLGGDVVDRHSTSGFVVFLDSNLISWLAKNQSIVSHSFTEAEYRSSTIIVVELLRLRQLLYYLHTFGVQPPLIWCDIIFLLFTLLRIQSFMGVQSTLKLIFTLFENVLFVMIFQNGTKTHK